MQAKKLAGPDAASQKYDVLTALGCHALGGPPGFQRLVLRFLTLVTARYNWRQGSLHVGQREIARLWSVDERTVKREMAKLRALGWLTVESPARRGRVATYALDLITIRTATREAWGRVGEDFESRMRGTSEPAMGGTVVPFPRPEASVPDAEEERGADSPRAGALRVVPVGDTWAQMRQLLNAEDAAVFANWFEPMRSTGKEAGSFVLIAPSGFHASYVRTHYADRLLAALRRSGESSDLRIVAGA